MQYIIQLATNVTEKVLAEFATEEAKIEHQQTPPIHPVRGMYGGSARFYLLKM
ncbi:hypothetical protein WG906_13375 [Pedobacter sp. P351]|uniref:hypothetical protein n=1 Tax=Pedobacter superstes TaxID=3133441 RepID=UPI003095D942